MHYYIYIYIEDNKYYLNNIMEKVIPKSKTKFLQNFFSSSFFRFFSFSFFFNIYSVDESDLQRDEVAIIKVFVKNIYIYICHTQSHSNFGSIIYIYQLSVL